MSRELNEHKPRFDDSGIQRGASWNLPACAGYIWIESPTQILIRVQHRDVYLDEVAKNLSCRKHGCMHTGVKLELIHTDDTSGFVGGCLEACGLF